MYIQISLLERGSIIIGTIPIIGYLGLTALIASFQKTYPGIQIQFREAGSDDLIKMLLASEIDIALLTSTHNQQHENTIDFYPLFDDEIVLITNRSHSFAAKNQIDLAEASHDHFVSMKSNYGMRKVFENACQEAGFKPIITYECNQVETICGLVENGLGIALLTSRIVESVKRPNLTSIRLKQNVKRTTAIAVNRHSYLTSTVAAFRDFTLKWIKEEFEERDVGS